MTIKKLFARTLQATRLELRQRWWQLRNACGWRERWSGTETLNVVLLSYRRMENLRYIVDSLLLCDFVERIVLSNNNPAVRMEQFVSSRDSRLQIINQPRRCYPSIRYQLAMQLSGQYFLAIDDDLFLTPRQIRKLFQRLLEHPSVPHGAAAEDIEVRDGKIVSRNVSWGKTRETDVILWAYAFTRQHLHRYFTLLNRLGMSEDEVKTSEDVIISFTGDGRPYCEDLGTLFCCDSATDAAIATWMQEGFLQERGRLYLSCREWLATEPWR